MNGVWQSLLWKEWREQRSKVLILIVLAAALAPLPLLFNGDDTFLQVLVPIGLLGLPAIGIFVGAGLAASEQSQQTIGFLQSLPSDLSRAAIVKLGVAGVVIAAPWLVLAGLLEIWEWPGYMQGHPPIPRLAVLALAWASASIAVWVAAIGVNLSDEVRAGAVGLLAVAMTWAAIVSLCERFHIQNDRVIEALVAPAPGGPAILFIELADAPQRTAAGYPSRSLWHLFLLAGFSTLGMAYAYQRRFGRVAPGRKRESLQVACSRAVERLLPPRRSPFTAILWKQFRETIPLAAMGAGTIFCISIIVSSYFRNGEPNLGALSLEMSVVVWSLTGALVAIVAGVGLMMDDLTPGLHSFWRSRPVDVDLWFFVKLLTGLIATIATLAIPTALVYAIVSLGGRGSQISGQQNWWASFALLVPLIQSALFCVAVATMTLLRRPVVAALVTSGTAVAFIVAASRAEGLQNRDAAVVLTLSAVLASIVAWVAVRRDWAIGR